MPVWYPFPLNIHNPSLSIHPSDVAQQQKALPSVFQTADVAESQVWRHLFTGTKPTSCWLAGAAVANLLAPAAAAHFCSLALFTFRAGSFVSFFYFFCLVSMYGFCTRPQTHQLACYFPFSSTAAKCCSLDLLHLPRAGRRLVFIL